MPSRSRSSSPRKSSRQYSRSRSRTPASRRSRTPDSRKSRTPETRRRSRTPDSRERYRERKRSPSRGGRRNNGNRENPESCNVLGVFGLSLYTTEKDLEKEFGQFGPIEKVQVVLDGHSGRSRGFAFINFENTDDAVEARTQMTGTEMDGRKIRVDFSITKRPHTPTPGMYMGRPTSGRSGGRDDDRRGGRGYGRDDRDRRRSPSPYRRRSPSPRRRSPSPYRRRSPSPYRRRSPSPYSRSSRRSRSRSPRY